MKKARWHVVKLGMIGLGLMGSNIALRLIQGGHTIVGHARHRETVDRLVKQGAVGAYSVDELVQKMHPPRKIWPIIPAGQPVDNPIQVLLPHLEPGDILIDGGNSNYKDTLWRTCASRKQSFRPNNVCTIRSRNARI